MAIAWSPRSTRRAWLACEERRSGGIGPNAMSDHLIDPEILWSKSTALRERVKTVRDELLAYRMRRLADDMASLAVELRLATIVEEVTG